VIAYLHPDCYQLSKREKSFELLLILKDIATTRNAPEQGWVVCGLYSVTVDIVFTSCVVHCYVNVFRWVGKCNFGLMGRLEDEGDELGSCTNPQTRDAAKRECMTSATVMEMFPA
jgi:hypothetical protein